MLENVSLQFRNQLVEIQSLGMVVLFVVQVTILGRLGSDSRL
jgi:hypothetical protein